MSWQLIVIHCADCKRPAARVNNGCSRYCIPCAIRRVKEHRRKPARQDAGFLSTWSRIIKRKPAGPAKEGT